MQRWFVGTDVLCTDRTLYFCNQRKDPRLFLCGIRVHRCCPASGNADLQRGWYVYSAVFQKIKVDPAVASGPLITTINDLVAVVSYYGLSWLFLIEFFHMAG